MADAGHPCPGSWTDAAVCQDDPVFGPQSCCVVPEASVPLPECVADETLKCTGAAKGYTCPPSSNPGGSNSGVYACDQPRTLSCTTPARDSNGNYTYCCIPWPTDTDTSCSPDDGLWNRCPDPDSYGFQCTEDDDNPMLVIPSLLCGRFHAGDGLIDFCCTLGGTGVIEGGDASGVADAATDTPVDAVSDGATASEP